MTNNDYQKQLHVKADPSEAYRAVTAGFADWWTDPEGAYRQTGDELTFAFPPHQTAWTFKAKKLVPNRLVQLRCTRAVHEEEWLGTTIQWTLTETAGGTQIDFIHQGLNPAVTCYDICRQGWDFFLGESLQAYLDGGTGKPHQPPTD